MGEVVEVAGGAAAELTGARSLVLSHLLLELLELARRLRLTRGTVHVGLEQLVLKIHSRTRPAGTLYVTPRALGAAIPFHHRPVSLGALELRLHILQLTLGQRELFTLGGQLSLEHCDAFAMLGGEALGNCNGFVILDLARKPAAPLSIRKALAFQCELSVSTGDGIRDFADGDFGVD